MSEDDGVVPDVGLVVTAEQWRAAGLTRAHLRTRRGRGDLSRLWRGVDLTASVTQVPLSALAAISPFAIVSGPSAARGLGYDVPRQWSEEITIPVGHPPVRARAGVRVVSRPVPIASRVSVGGVTCTDPARTVADLLCRPELRDAVWVLDQALAGGLDHGAVAACLSPRQRGCRSARTRLVLGRAESESPLETRVRLSLQEDGVPTPTLQHVVRSPGGAHVARLDFAWPEAKVALEADGVGWHSAPGALFADRRRANALELLGWIVLRVTWEDIVRDPAGVTRAVLLALQSR